MAQRLREHRGISLVELLIAVALLSMVSVAALQFIRTSETTMFGEQALLNQQQRSEAISAHIYRKFISRTLTETATETVYTDPAMADDLRNGPGVTLVTLLGNSSRFDGVDPRCTLVSDADVTNGTFQIKHDCVTRGSQSIVQQMNDLIGKGVTLTTGLEEGVGRCSISKPISIDQSTDIATVTVDDPGCLFYALDMARGVPTGNQVLLPRFVVYDTASPATFHTSMIEPPDVAKPGIGLEMPDNHTVVGHGGLNVLSIVDALANDPQANVFLELQTEEPMSRLKVPSIPATVRMTGGGSAKLSLQGPLANVRDALEKLEYRSPKGYLGTDRLSGKLQTGSLVHRDNTTLLVKGNCGGQKCGTATRFDLGEFDPVTKKFTVKEYVTSVSVCGSDLPSTYYGYCRPNFIFDRADGLERPLANDDYKTACALASGLTYGDPNNSKKAGYPYVLYSPKSRENEMKDMQLPDYVTVFLYEQESTTLPRAVADRLRPTRENRFSLFFQFDSYDASPGDVTFTLNNIQPGRVLSDRADPFTVLDDPTEYFPKVHPTSGQLLSRAELVAAGLSFGLPTKIGPDGTLTSRVEWLKPNDGLVVPLPLGRNAIDPLTGRYLLRGYSPNPGGVPGVNSNPNLQMKSWSGLNGWNIRATSDNGTAVVFKQIDFNAAASGRKADIQLRISGAQPCS